LRRAFTTKENVALAPLPYLKCMSQWVRKGLARRRVELICSDDGAAAIEYALLGALIASAIVVTVSLLGSSLNATFSGVSSAVGGAQSGPLGGVSGPNGNGNGKGGNGKGNNGNGNGNGGPQGGPVP